MVQSTRRAGSRQMAPAPFFSEDAASGYYHQVVISASGALVGRPAEGLAREVLAELCAIWAKTEEVKLLRHRVVTVREAVFSARPGLEACRPSQATPVANFTLAGDWTATGWPGTMESAVRSGYLAVEAIMKQLGRPEPILVADLPRGCLARWMLGG